MFLAGDSVDEKCNRYLRINKFDLEYVEAQVC